MKLYRLIFSVILISCNAMASESVGDIISANNKISEKLYEILSKNGNNVLYSPLSLHTILSLLYEGTAGATAESLKSVLYLSDPKTTAKSYQTLLENLNSVKNVSLDIANKVYVQQGYKLKDEFSSVAENQFLSEAENVNFAEKVVTAKYINDWVERKTNKKITDIIEKDDLDEYTRLILVNAIYFLGNWKYEFDKNHTEKANFYLSEKDSVECDMMYMERFLNYSSNNELDAQVLSLPYKNEYMNLIIVLPRSRTGINDLERKLQTSSWASIYENLYVASIKVWLPKFKIETEIHLEDSLTKMGLGGIFDETTNFSNLLDSKEPFAVSKIVQKAFLEVNELGTAAVATSVEEISIRIFSRSFMADHPFIFVITYRQNDAVLPLFVGKLTKI